MFRRSETAVFRSVADGAEGVILDTESGEYYSVNAVGAAIWEAIDGQHDTQAIRDLVCERFPDAPADRVHADVSEFLEELRQRGLISSPEAR